MSPKCSYSFYLLYPSLLFIVYTLGQVKLIKPPVLETHYATLRFPVEWDNVIYEYGIAWLLLFEPLRAGNSASRQAEMQVDQQVPSQDLCIDTNETF